MTLYVAVDGTDPEALDAADDELIAETVHQLLCDEVLVQDIETVGIVENLEDEVDGAVIDKTSLEILANDVSSSVGGPGVTPEQRIRLSDAMNKAYNALHGNGENDD
jgi:hypothetical protein